MLRTLLGYAVIAIVAFFALKIVFALLGVAISLFWNLIWLAAVGFLIYLVIKVVSPHSAARIDEAIRGRRHDDAA